MQSRDEVLTRIRWYLGDGSLRRCKANAEAFFAVVISSHEGVLIKRALVPGLSLVDSLSTQGTHACPYCLTRTMTCFRAPRVRWVGGLQTGSFGTWTEGRQPRAPLFYGRRLRAPGVRGTPRFFFFYLTQVANGALW